MIAERPFYFATGEGFAWYSRKTTLARELERGAFGPARPGPKEGLGYTQGPLRDLDRSEPDPHGTPRREENVHSFWSIAKDNDSGVSPERFHARMRDLGLGYLWHPSWSNGKESVHVAASLLSALAPDPLEAVQRYYTRRGADPSLVASLRSPESYEEPDQWGRLVPRWRFRCDPWPKWRAFLLLKSPLWVTVPPGLSAAQWKASAEFSAIKREWHALYLGFDDLVEIEFDATRDLARFMYCTSCPPGRDPRDYAAVLYEGAPLDVSLIQPRALEATDAEPKATRAERAVSRVAPRAVPDGCPAGVHPATWAAMMRDVGRAAWTPRTANLFKFARACPDFDPAAFVRAFRPPGYHECSGGAVACACPLSEEHSARMSDAPLYARPGVDGKSWHLMCQHRNGPSHGDRADRLRFLDELCNRLGIRDALALRVFCNHGEK